jgi:cytoskeletal protein CcmA (bactofilin family)
MRETPKQPDKDCAFFGEGVMFSGSLAAAGKIVVHGAGEGEIAARELLVSGNGMIKGDVRVERADIHGRVLDKIEARDCLVLRKSGRIDGAASYGEIEIEKGGIVCGETRSLKPLEEAAFPSLTFGTRVGR